METSVYRIELRRGIHDLMPTHLWSISYGNCEHELTNDEDYVYKARANGAYIIRLIEDRFPITGHYGEDESRDIARNNALQTAKENKQLNDAYVKRLKEEGLYGRVYGENKIFLKRNELFDSKSMITGKESYSFKMLNIGCKK